MADTAPQAIAKIESELPLDFPVVISTSVKGAITDRLRKLRVQAGEGISTDEGPWVLRDASPQVCRTFRREIEKMSTSMFMPRAAQGPDFSDGILGKVQGSQDGDAPQLIASLMASSNKKVIYAALIGNSLIAFTKFAASALTGSSVMLAEGIHSSSGHGQSRAPALWTSSCQTTG